MPISLTSFRIDHLLREGVTYLARQDIDSPRLSAEVLLAHAAGMRRLDLLIRPELELQEEIARAFLELVRRRGEGEPVAYLAGHREFYGREFEVGPQVLIPRPETELFLDVCKELIPAGAQMRVADICAGSGNLGVTLCCEYSAIQCIMADISRSALQLALKNARRHHVADRMLICQQDFASALVPESLDLVVCNPPYVSADEYLALSCEVADFEPKMALYGGRDGLEASQKAIVSIALSLRPGGFLILETGRDQAEALASDLTQAGTGWDQVRVHQDLAGNPRLVSARKVLCQSHSVP